MVQRPGTTDEVGRFLLLFIVLLLVVASLWVLWSWSESEAEPAPREPDLRAEPR